MFAANEIDYLCHNGLIQRIVDSGLYDNIANLAAAAIERETGYTAATLSDSQKEQLMPAFAYIVNYLAESQITGLTADAREIIRSKYEGALKILRQFAKAPADYNDNADVVDFLGAPSW